MLGWTLVKAMATQTTCGWPTPSLWDLWSTWNVNGALHVFFSFLFSAQDDDVEVDEFPVDPEVCCIFSRRYVACYVFFNIKNMSVKCTEVWNHQNKLIWFFFDRVRMPKHRRLLRKSFKKQKNWKTCFQTARCFCPERSREKYWCLFSGKDVLILLYLKRFHYIFN